MACMARSTVRPVSGAMIQSHANTGAESSRPIAGERALPGAGWTGEERDEREAHESLSGQNGRIFEGGAAAVGGEVDDPQVAELVSRVVVGDLDAHDARVTFDRDELPRHREGLVGTRTFAFPERVDGGAARDGGSIRIHQVRRVVGEQRGKRIRARRAPRSLVRLDPGGHCRAIDHDRLSYAGPATTGRHGRRGVRPAGRGCARRGCCA